MSSRSQDDNGDKIGFAKFINEHNLQLVNHTDTKTSIIIGIDGVLLGLLFDSLPSHDYPALQVAFVIGVGLLGLSAFYGLWAIFPLISRFKRNKDSMVYHETILLHNLTLKGQRKWLYGFAKRIQRHKDEVEGKKFYEYLKRWGLPSTKVAIRSKFNNSTPMDNDRILYEEVRSVCMLAGKLHHMVTRVRWSLFFLVLAVILLAATLSMSSIHSSYPSGHVEKCGENPDQYGVNQTALWQCSKFSNGSLAEQCANDPSRYHMNQTSECSRFIPPNNPDG